MTKNIYMMVGAAGAGKSTFIKNFFPDAFGVSRDVARFDVMAKYKTDDYFAHEKEAFNTYINRINSAIKCGWETVVLDATHLTPKSRKKVLCRINIPKEAKLYAVVVRPTLEQHIKQNAQRTGKAFVPVDAIVKQYNSYIEPTHEEGFDDVFFGEVTKDVEEK